MDGQSSDLYTSKNSSLQDKLESIKKKIITLRESIKKALMKRLLNIILNISPIRKIREFVFGQFKSTYCDFGEIFFCRHFFTCIEGKSLFFVFFYKNSLKSSFMSQIRRFKNIF